VPDDQISRRRVLTGLTVTLLASVGCSSSASHPPAMASPRPDPDIGIRTAAADTERALLGAYAATIARHPALAEQLEPLSAHHSEHLAAFAEAAGGATPSSTATAGSTAATAPPASASASASDGSLVPDDPALAVAALAAAERDTAARRLTELQSASPELARLLASSAGAESAHAALLGS
jgi:hypothetical protein